MAIVANLDTYIYIYIYIYVHELQYTSGKLFCMFWWYFAARSDQYTDYSGPLSQLIGRRLLAAARNTYMVVGSLLVTCIIGFIFVGYQAGPSLYPINFDLSRRRKHKSVEKTPQILRYFSPLFRLRKMRCFDTLRQGKFSSQFVGEHRWTMPSWSRFWW